MGEKMKSGLSFICLPRQLLVEEKEGLLGDIAFLQVCFSYCFYIPNFFVHFIFH